MLSSMPKTKFKSKKRVGRGNSAGGGTTAGRGTKGQKSRSGGRVRPGFEGGQMPLQKRVPKKRGFKSMIIKPIAIDIMRLNIFKDGEKINLDALKKQGIIKGKKIKVKIVGNGDLKKKLIISVPISKTAESIIKKAGGKIEINAKIKNQNAK